MTHTRLQGLWGAPLGVLLALALGFAPAFADAVRLRPDLSPGRTWMYDLSLDLLVNQSQTDSRLVQSARVKFVVQSVDEAGVATIGCAFQSLVAVWTDGEGQVEFVWSGGDAPPPAGEAESPFRSAARTLAAATVTLKVGPDGRVRSVDGLQESLGALGDQKRFPAAALGLFAPGQAPSSIEAIWRGDKLVDQPASAGAGWQTTVRVPLGPAGALEVTTDWVVMNATADTIAYTGDERAEVLRPAHPDAAAPSVRIDSFEGSIAGAWSVQAGAMKSRTAKRTMAASWTLGDVTVQQSQLAKTGLTLVENPPRPAPPADAGAH